MPKAKRFSQLNVPRERKFRGYSDLILYIKRIQISSILKYSDAMKQIALKKLSIVFAIFICLLSNRTLSKDSVNLSTPQNAVETHLRYLKDDNYRPKLAAKSFEVDNPTAPENQELAEKLKEIFDGMRLSVNIDGIPDEPNYIDSASGKQRYILLKSIPEIYLKKYGDEWKYSETTVKMIPDIYQSVYPFELSKIIKKSPRFFKDELFGIYVWQYILMLIYVIIGYGVYKLFSGILGYAAVKIIHKTRFKEIAAEYIKPVTKPISLIFVFLIAISFLPILRLPAQFDATLDKILTAFIPAFATVIAYKFVDLLAEVLAKLASKTETTIDDNLTPLVRKMLKIIVVIFGFIYILQTFDVSITPLLAGVSIGGLAFALAAQETVKNLFGSITIFTDQPFNVGDWIVFDGGEGTVIEVGVRSTRIRTFYDSVISIPNGKLADALIDNMGRRNFRRYSALIGLTYDSPPEKVEKFVEELKAITDNHPKTRKDFYQIHANNFGQTAIEILFYIFFDVPDWTQELESRHDVIIEILKAADKLGLRFAYPIRDFSKNPIYYLDSRK